MKTRLYLLFFLAWAMTACEEDGSEVTTDTDIAYTGNGALIRSENMSNIRFKDVPGQITLDESIPEGEIRVEGTQSLEGWIVAEDGGGELRIEGKDGMPASLDLHFHMHPHELRKIVVEGDNRVEFLSTPVMEHLELVTEGESELIIHDMKVRHLVSRREGKSRMYLSNELSGYDHDEIFFLASDVQVLEDNYILYKDGDMDYLLWAPRLEMRDDKLYAFAHDGDPLRAFFLTQTHEMVNQGESYLDALGLPTLAVSSRNEGESESKVWAVHRLDVKGEGESLMYYFGFPAVNKQMSGDSRLIHLP